MLIFSRSGKHILFFLLSFILLFLGFYKNTWNAAGKKWFYDWKQYQDVLVIGRLAESAQKGLFSHSGFIGLGDADSWSDGNSELTAHQMDVYLNSGTFEKYASYKTESAGYGFLFGAIDQLTNFSPGVNLKLFRAIVSGLSAAALAGFILWTACEFNFSAALFLLLFCMFSEWLALFGGSIYWNPWAYFLPFLSVLSFFSFSPRNSFSNKKLFLLILLSVLVTEFIRGFVFITATLIMLTAPVVYYAVKEDWGIRLFFQRMVVIITGSITATVLALGILAAQIYAETGSMSTAAAHLMESFMKRSFARAENYSDRMAESLSANPLEVLSTYLTGRAINFNQIFHTKIPALEISFASILLFFALISIIALVWLFFTKNTQRMDKKFLALIVCTWYSILAPLSWLIIFKAHSFIHTQINFILWQLPFTLLGFVLTGYSVSRLFKRVPPTSAPHL